MEDRTQLWNELAAQIAVDSIRATTAAGSGHPTSSMSAAHLLAVLFADHLRFDVKDPDFGGNDRFILSKGHAAPALYATLKMIGAFGDDELLSLRKEGSPLQGHPAPIPEMPWVDVATGSLGQGLAVGLGMALSMRIDGTDGRVWVLLGDSEMAEGSVWEAMEAVSFHRAGAVTAILDLNRLGQRGPTMHGWHADVFRDRAQAFGWTVLEIDGHDVQQIDRAYRDATADDRPTFIVARTEKGHGVSFLADQEGWHGKPVPADRMDAAIAELGGVRDLVVTPPSPPELVHLDLEREDEDAPAPVYDDPVATRKAFGDALAWLARHRPDLVVLDGEVGNSTYTEEVEAVAPERFIQMYIAEQSMIGAQTGLQALGKTAFAATFGAFLTRAADQIRMGAIGRADLRISGSHAGISIGEDGPSQMAVEDLAMFRTLNGSTVLYPADGNATVRLVTEMSDLQGISFLRTTREATPRLYPPDEAFPVGGSKTLASSGADRVTLVAAGITLHEALAAHDVLGAEGIAARVLDCYSVKPIDAATLRRALDETQLLVVVEDHRVEGGLGDAVLDALAATGPLHGRVVKLGVSAMPGSATAEQLRSWAGIDATSIAAAARRALG
ncbi:MAG TPA: transketolase [Actinomycetota bacterium]|nr:transketolase [Actinomycetota bacterium]